MNKRVRIQAIEYYLPEQEITNEDLSKENPAWDMQRVAAQSGVLKRHVARAEETALDLAVRACDKLFLNEGIAKEDVDGLIFCTQSPDYIMPSNAFLLHKHLDLSTKVIAFDYNLACSGYVYGLAIAQGFILSGLARNILLVTADTYSKYIHPEDRSTRVLFGDGAAVSLIANSSSGCGMIDFAFGTSGKDYDKFYIPAGGCRRVMQEIGDNGRLPQNIHMDGRAIWSFVNSAVPQQIVQLLSQHRLRVDDIDLFIFHQASKLTLDSLASVLQINPEKMFVNLEKIGNTVSASIPIALKDATEQKRIASGDKVLLSGFGVGLSYASCLMEF